MILIPPEFRRMPALRPPDMQDRANPYHYWTLEEDWLSPPAPCEGKFWRIAIRRGFLTDGISIPRIFWTVEGMHPFSMPGLCFALPHDGAYSAELVPRQLADNWLFRFAMLAGCGEATANKCLLAVRLGGGEVWAEHSPESIAWNKRYVKLIPEHADLSMVSWEAA